MDVPVDKYGFLRNHDNWANHLPLVFLALEETKTNAHPILELGGHENSTPLIHEYCIHERRRAAIIEIIQPVKTRNTADGLLVRDKTGLQWGHLDCEYHEVMSIKFNEIMTDQDNVKWSVAIITSRPGERRKLDAAALINCASIIILRDTEPNADGYKNQHGMIQGGYGYSEIWPLFKSRVDIKTSGAWSSAVSNSIDLSKWRGLKVGPWTVTGSEDDKAKNEVDEKIKDFIASEAAGLEPMPIK